LKGGPFTSLMMTGNLRTAAQSLYDGFIRGQQKGRASAATVGTIILSFALGAGVTGILTHAIGTYALAGATLVLILIDLLLWRDQKTLPQSTV
ncbi:membrane protein, partial [Lacticaseibacillus rhamnosus]